MPIELSPPANALWMTIVHQAATAPPCEPALVPRSCALLALFAALQAMTIVGALHG